MAEAHNVGDVSQAERRFCMLGGLVVREGESAIDLGARKQQLVLAVLLLERDRTVSVDRLVDILWPDGGDKVTASLHAYVSRLRSTLEPQRRPREAATVLVSRAPGYRLVVPRTAVDLCTFEDHVAAGLSALRSGDRAAAVGALESALRCWTGPLLPEFADQPIIVAAARRATELRLDAVEGLAECRLTFANPLGARALLEFEAAENPTRERLQGLLALSLYRLGRQADALRVVERCRRSLAETAGLELSPELRSLERELLDQAPSLDLRPAAPIGANIPAAADATPADTPDATRATPEQAGAHGAMPLPVGRLADTAFPVIGRVSEVRVMEAAVAAAGRGRGGIAVIVGEPGIGKTRLAQHAIDVAKGLGARTVWVRCPESRSVPPFWAPTQLIDQLRDPDASDINLETRRDDRFTYERSVLRALTSGNEVVVAVVDDLQWADPDSLRLIAHIATDLAAAGVLLIATVRPLADEAPDALVECLAELSRCPDFCDLRLVGLSIDDVMAWLVARAGAGSTKVAEVILERTSGNPLFIRELTELLVAEGRLDDETAGTAASSIPPGVQFVVRRRVARVPVRCQQLLVMGAVIGRSFDMQTLADVADTTVDTLVHDIGPAVDAGLLVAADGELAFSHNVVADALAVEMNSMRRAAIHAAAARSLAERAGSRFGRRAAVIAHHARAGAVAGTSDMAIEAGTRAAEIAESRLAFEDAAAHWADVAEVLTRFRPGDVAGAVEATIRQARALTSADYVFAVKAPILAAVRAAEESELFDLAADALILLNDVHVWSNVGYGFVDTDAVGALERAIHRCGDTNTPRKAQLLGALAAELVHASRERHSAACDLALSVARGSGDPAIIARVLNNTMAINRADSLDVRRARANEILSLATRHGLDASVQFVGHFHLAECSLEEADLEAAARELAHARRWLEQLPLMRLHGQQGWVEAALAVATGDYDRAGEMADAAHEMHRRCRVYDDETIYFSSQVAIRLDRGGLETIGSLPMPAKSAYTRVVAETSAFAMLELGLADAAAAFVAPYVDSRSWPDDYTTLCCATAALHVRVEIEERVGAAAAAEVLTSYERRWASAGTSPLSLGPVSLALARHASSLGDHDRARVLADDAVTTCERAGAVAWLARSLVHRGDILASGGDSALAAESRTRARLLATRHRLPYVLRRLDNVRE